MSFFDSPYTPDYNPNPQPEPAPQEQAVEPEAPAETPAPVEETTPDAPADAAPKTTGRRGGKTGGKTNGKTNGGDKVSVKLIGRILEAGDKLQDEGTRGIVAALTGKTDRDQQVAALLSGTVTRIATLLADAKTEDNPTDAMTRILTEVNGGRQKTGDKTLLRDAAKALKALNPTLDDTGLPDNDYAVAAWIAKGLFDTEDVHALEVLL